MTASSRLLRSRRPRSVLVAGVLALAVFGAGCIPEPAPPPPVVCDPPAGSAPSAVAVMGPCVRLDVDQIVSWFEGKTTRPAYRALVPIRDLVTLYVEEGQAEGVRGDLALVQGIIETGWFSFGGRVPPEANNFAGIGATDGTSLFAVFESARIGVRAHIQHLRAYADASATTCTAPPLANPCVDPRFHLVAPKGKAPTWNQFGNGIWATDPGYAGKILNLYSDMLASAGLTLA
jgi:hypothetical protein